MNIAFNETNEIPDADRSVRLIDRLPREVTNRVTGDRMRIIHSAADGRESVKIEFTLPPHAKGAPLHYHLGFDESFEVLDGRLEMAVGASNATRIVAPGEIVTVSKGTLHSFANPHAAPVVFVSEAAPAAEFEKFVRGMYGLANDGRTNSDGMPNNFLQLALILDFADLYFPVVPASIQRIVRKTLAGFARTVGADREVLKYSENNR